ncbi:MAG TPA: NAD-dependent epimerase/dehydratase family protein [Acidimicrobiia bacterium]|nr:NAD-dependent epimerase/dehydratase family protein [Acidimicrobiia bacterium]
MRVLVTGGAGFIGAGLVERLLAEGEEVDVIDDLSTGSLANLGPARAGATGRLSFHRLDIRHPGLAELVATRQPEMIFHLAAQADVRVSVDNPALDADINILGSLHLCQAALAAGTRKIVFAGSGGTLYGVPESLPVGEGHSRRPVSPYGVAKKAVGDYLHYYREIRGLDYTVLALANVYGPRQDPHGEAGVVAIFAGKLLAGETPTIFGDGEQTRDFVFVDDVVDAFARARSGGSGLLANVGTGVETSVNELYSTMAGLTGSTGPATYSPARPGELARSALDPTLLGEELGWKPLHTLEDGLARTLDWFRAREP